jgi:hypothetical protein
MRYCRRKKMQVTDAASLAALALVNILEQRSGRKWIKKDGDKSRMFCWVITEAEYHQRS